MHGSRAENAGLVEAIVASHGLGAADCAVCPPFVYLADVARSVRDSTVALGAQDVCAEAQGAYTGEVSAAMLRDVGCTMVIVGHSERRALYGEGDSLVARKFAAAQARGLSPILCVGESLAEREAGQTTAVVARQLDAVLELAGAAALATAVLAYEPVWAIGTGRIPSTEDVAAMHGAIRAALVARFGAEGNAIRILYGGSMNGDNAASLLAIANVDGGLIGGASLKAEKFLPIVAAAAAA